MSNPLQVRVPRERTRRWRGLRVVFCGEEGADSLQGLEGCRQGVVRVLSFVPSLTQRGV